MSKSKFLPMRGGDGGEIVMGAKVWVFRDGKPVSARVVKAEPWRRKVTLQFRNGKEQVVPMHSWGQQNLWTTLASTGAEWRRRMRDDVRYHKKQALEHGKLQAQVERQLESFKIRGISP